MAPPSHNEPERCPTGIEGLDDILGGGLPQGVIHLIEGDPGAGKTTLGLRFLIEGVRRGERGLFVNLSNTRTELDRIFRAHGWSSEGISILDLAASQESLASDQQYTVFHPSEVELSETTQSVLAAMDEVQPQRVVLDAASEMRLLARDSLRFRRQVWALKDYFGSRGCTVLMLDYQTAPENDLQLHSLSSGVITMEQLSPEYGGQRRRLRLQKMRAIPFRDGYHDYTIQTGGVLVYPRLVASEHFSDRVGEKLGSGVPELDALMGGGLEFGTSLLVMGPAGVGKTTLTSQYVVSALRQGIKSAVFLFDEGTTSFLARAERLGMGMRGDIASGALTLRQIDPAELSPGEFATAVRHAVERDGARVVVLDSLNGYRNAMPEEKFLTAHMHELTAYLNQKGILTMIILGQAGIVGQIQAPVDVSYLSDAVALMRHFEVRGQMRKALSVVKMRAAAHEPAIRELSISDGGIRVGEPLEGFQGILTGQPVFTGRWEDLLKAEERAKGGEDTDAGFA